MNKPTLPGATGYSPVEGADLPIRQGDEQPDVIWTYDAQGKRLHGRPNFDKPGVAEQVERDAFYNECAAHPPRSSLGLLMRLRRINRFEDERLRGEPRQSGSDR